MLVWYYSFGNHLDTLRRAGVLTATGELVHHHGKPAVWFSAHPVWEQAANRTYRDELGIDHPLNKEQLHQLGGGLIRIGVTVDEKLLRWDRYKEVSGITPKEARALYQAALARGSRPGDWYASLEPVPAERWAAIEFWDGMQWQPTPPAQVFVAST